MRSKVINFSFPTIVMTWLLGPYLELFHRTRKTTPLVIDIYSRCRYKKEIVMTF